jgi:hypothetical protein
MSGETWTLEALSATTFSLVCGSWSGPVSILNQFFYPIFLNFDCIHRILKFSKNSDQQQLIASQPQQWQQSPKTLSIVRYGQNHLLICHCFKFRNFGQNITYEYELTNEFQNSKAIPIEFERKFGPIVYFTITSSNTDTNSCDAAI